MPGYIASLAVLLICTPKYIILHGCHQDLQLVHDISQKGRLEVLDLSQTAVRVGEPLCRALLLSTAGLTVLSTPAPRQRVQAVGVSPTANGRPPLRELSLGGNTCALMCSLAAHVPNSSPHALSQQARYAFTTTACVPGNCASDRMHHCRYFYR